MVPRCLVWAIRSDRQPKVKVASEQIHHRLKVTEGPIAPRLCLGRLDETVDPLDQPVGDLTVEPAQDAVAVTLDGVAGRA